MVHHNSTGPLDLSGLRFENITVLGIQNAVSKVSVDSADHLDFHMIGDYKLEITNLDLVLDNAHEVVWS